ncbi:MAG: hypothetical protein AAF989_09245 [Planctomycetota bacterium]
MLWSESPAPDDGVLPGRFEISRSQIRGDFGIEGEELLRSIEEHDETPITLLVIRETGKTDGVGKVLIHAFASASHPESVGPQLELPFG